MSTQQIITDGTTDRVIDAPRVVLPARPTVFAERAQRFDQLAQDHSLGPYLGLMAHVSRAQHAVFTARGAAQVPQQACAQSRAYGMPPLSALSHQRDPGWRSDLYDIAAQIAAPQAADVLRQLRGLDEGALEALADRVLTGNALDAEAALVPFVGAALQVYFTRSAATLAADDVAHSDVPTVCPVCATRPVASIVHIGGQQANLRYLVCALCATEWNMARITCTSCEKDKNIEYLALSGAGVRDKPAVRAECCGECRSYLKIVDRNADPSVDPVADDLATLALDLLVDEQGFLRSGPNLLFHPGSA